MARTSAGSEPGGPDLDAYRKVIGIGKNKEK